MSNDRLEVSFKSTYDPSTPRGIKLPLSVDTRLYFIQSFLFLFTILQNYSKFLIYNLLFRYILKSGVSGFHCYAIYERPPGCQPFDLAQTRMVFKLRREK